MLRTNLSTRPFYNDRAVRVGIAVAVVLIAALTTFNALQVFSLNARNSEMSGRAAQAEAQTAQFRDEARRITQALDKAEVTAVQDAAHEANRLIDQRAFSWTDLFNRFEHTLPADVRISAVEPQVDREGRLLISVTTVSRRLEDLHAFIDLLETSGGLRDVIPRVQDTLDDGTLRAIVQGYYDRAAVAQAAATASPASESNGTAQNRPAPAPNAPPAGPDRGPR